jgi:hypothetical protein
LGLDGIQTDQRARDAERGYRAPYSPDHNRIERLWQDLHANVTRNHRHQTLDSLCEAVSQYLNWASPWLPLSRFTPRHRIATEHHRPQILTSSRSAAPESRSLI